MNSVLISDKSIGQNKPVFIIAEAGVNHNGSLKMAKELVAKAKEAGADCIKFQTFKAERVVTRNAPKAEYQLKTTSPAESQLQMLQKLELSFAEYEEIIKFCHQKDIIFMSTPYSQEDVDFLVGLNVPAFKIASGQLVEPSFLAYVAHRSLPILLSTGMATLDEVGAAVKVILNTGNKNLVLLQCSTNYPTLPEDANLRAMTTMRDAFCLNVGYSDHTQSHMACIASVAMGASVVEKHFTLDKSLPGPDHSSSASPEELCVLVKEIREVQKMLGNGVKVPTVAEKKNMSGMRRSIVAKESIKAGTLISSEMLTFKRPATGISPTQIDVVVGAFAKVDIVEDSIITWGDISR
ncbi:MAG: N-acetylneuraminate synthase [Chloroflexi bacterium GWC2_49_37]|nr:MAG: N-acetylneuraminate synthase [Chloroflexi bacterium GWC2_49_37]